MGEFWLKCKTSEGMFPSEMAVTGITADGIHFSLFADKSFIKMPEVCGDNFLRVRAINQGASNFHVRLPGDPFETRRIILVDPSLIEGKAA